MDFILHNSLKGTTNYQEIHNGISITGISYSEIDGKTINEIAIYSKLANGGTWGLSALTSISGLDFEAMSDEQKRQLNLMPAMLYHGVNNEESVLMRMNSVPRSIAGSIGNNFKQQVEKRNIATARKYLKGLHNEDWAIKANF
ncbi:MAG: hypothetical protein HFP77_07700 [Methylococcales symbiont of Iophon sp. n. MRB-2018]|nr:MAG: hypothetical protein HFP77_07700 [Methylococcales symbiont of Iophon sp. n. MRB-2018]KAF3979769.1 MAG: hypothetical protein HFP76_05455 [Methylococcales symbiont of Iophon sp. n. MRB-2018]